MTEAQSLPSNEHRFDARINVAFFIATVATVFWAGGSYWALTEETAKLPALERTLSGWTFAVPLLAILLFHEFGHYIAARIHRVPASLPYFIPVPIALGTFGAVIAMPDRIRSKNALLDIGAAGPLAGLVVAIPVVVVGLWLSPVLPNPESNYMVEGQNLLYIALKYLVHGPIPEGHDVHLHPTAAAGWAGLLLTMFNLIPFGQLDGGHISYALLGERHALLSRWVRWGLLLLFLGQLVRFSVPVLLGTSSLPWALAIANSWTWLLWFGLLSLMKRIGGGYHHPPTDDSTLSPKRRLVGWGTAVLFVALFMPTPFTSY